MESTRMQYDQNSTHKDREWQTANMDKITLATRNYCWLPKYEHFHVLSQTIKRLRCRWEVITVFMQIVRQHNFGGVT